jgi:succinate dehydrogenase / fumarate reductase flavoprotein subunit
MFDTVKGSDYLGDQDAIEFMCRNANEVVYELEHYGMPFDRTPDGRIYQRPFGGQTRNYGEGPGQALVRGCRPHRTRDAAHAIPAQRAGPHAVFRRMDGARPGARSGRRRAGVVALEMETGEVMILQAKATLLATGGGGRIYSASTNAFINTADGLGMAARAGIPLEDMEFWQFHPTGVAGAGVLITEGVRGEGGFLLNKNGERFMERYAPTVKDLASRDVVSRAMATEIKEGRGAGKDGEYILLKLDHLGAEVIDKRLPAYARSPRSSPTSIRSKSRSRWCRRATIRWAASDQLSRPGLHARTGRRENRARLYAAGECSCVSVHGANRLGTNSLLDLLVFGKAAGETGDQGLAGEKTFKDLPQDAADRTLARLARLDSASSGESVSEVGAAMRRTMQLHCGVFRFPDSLAEGVAKILEIAARSERHYIKDKSKVFNTARVEALELDNLIDTAVRP